MKEIHRMLFSVLVVFLLEGCKPEERPSDRTKESTPPVGELIPRSGSENAKYYLISLEKVGKHLKTIHSRISAKSTGYSLTLIDCGSERYKDLGYGGSQSSISIYESSKWTDLVPGSSKSDLLRFACKKV